MIIEALENGKASGTRRPHRQYGEGVARHLREAYGHCPAVESAPRRTLEGTLEFRRAAPGVAHGVELLFDIVHHRGQISTYLRPMGSTVPQIYGPSGDGLPEP